jgi:hypothetical protein
MSYLPILNNNIFLCSFAEEVGTDDLRASEAGTISQSQID